MKVQKSQIGDRWGDVWTVSVDPGELEVESGKTLPYATTIGTFNSRGTINVWTPAAYTPRGYKAAARDMLERASRAKQVYKKTGSMLAVLQDVHAPRRRK